MAYPTIIQNSNEQRAESLDSLDLCVKYINKYPKKSFQILRLPASWFFNAPDLDPSDRDLLTKICTIFSDAIGVYNIIQIFPSANSVRHSGMDLINEIQLWEKGTEQEVFPWGKTGTFFINDLIPMAGSSARVLNWLSQKTIINLGVMTTPIKYISALSLVIIAIKGLVLSGSAFYVDPEKSETLEIDGRTDPILFKEEILKWLELFSSLFFIVSIAPAVIGLFVAVSLPATLLVILTAISLGLGIIVFALEADIENEKKLSLLLA